MDDIDLQFDIEVPFEQDKKTKKPFPGDFSFNADGLLEDCEVEEIPAEPEQAPPEDVVADDIDDIDDEDEPLWEEFCDVFEEEDVPEETILVEDIVVETEADETDEADEEDDDATLWAEFRDVFEEEVPVQEPVEDETVEDTAGTEELVADAEADEAADEEDEEEDEEDDDATLWAEFRGVFEEAEVPAALAAAEEIVEEPEAIIVEDEVPVEDVPVQEPVDEDDVDEEDEEDFEFPEDLDTECDFVAVPKPTVTVSTWAQVRQRAATQQEKRTYETGNFVAVEEDYTEQPKPKQPTPAEQVMGISAEDQQEDDAAEAEPVQPIWYVDDTDHPEELNTEVSDEDMDYDDIFNDDRTAYRKKKKRKTLLQKILKEIGLFLAIIVGALVLVVNFTIFCSRQNTVVGHSMEPTLHGGDQVYTTMLPYIFGEPKVGDIVVFDYSCHGKDMGYFHRVGEVLKNNRLAQIFKDPAELQLDEYWIKRVVAVAGDTVSFKDNQFYRNGELVEEYFILEQTVTDYENGKAYVVPEGQVFVMGDNRNNSTDSRVIGCIDIDIITGKVWKKG